MKAQTQSIQAKIKKLRMTDPDAYQKTLVDIDEMLYYPVIFVNEACAKKSLTSLDEIEEKINKHFYS